MSLRNLLVLSLLGLLGLAACVPQAEAPGSLAPTAFQARLAQPGVQLVDVRQPEEYQQARLAGSKLLPLGQLQDSLGALDKSRPVLLYCRTGRRSARAAALLQAAGFKDVSHLDGGLKAWSAAGLPVEAP